MMADQQQRHKHPSQRKGGAKKKKSGKIKAPFFPNSPTSVGSPKDDGAHFHPRPVRQRTPSRLCSLVLPPPLISLFDHNNSGAVDASTPANARPAAASSDNASLDGHSTLDNTASLTATPVRYSSNASAVSASVVSAAPSVGGISSARDGPRLPPHLRAGMAPCDPLLAFDGRFVLVGTCDGRIAIYSVVDFNDPGGSSEDVAASERRRRAEWKEEDDFVMRQHRPKGGDEKDDEPSTQPNIQKNESANEPSSDAEEEENECDLRDRMHRREKARQSVEPVLIVTLPQSNNHGPGDDKSQLNSGSYDEESTISVGNVANPPTIVSMCATPGCGTSFIEQRDVARAEDQTDMVQTSSQPLVPSFGKELLGHAAVLVDDGEVHILEFLLAPSKKAESREGDAEYIGANEISNGRIPIVNCVVSFRTGHLGATCICMHPVFDDNRKGKGSQRQTLSTTELVLDEPRIRLCVGHLSGILTGFEIHSTCIRQGDIKASNHFSRGMNTKIEPSDQSSAQHHSHEKQNPYDSLDISHTRSKSDDNMEISHAKAAAPAPRVLFQKNTETGAGAKRNDLGKIPIQRTLSEPIALSGGEESDTTPMVGPARVMLRWRGKFDVPIRSVSSPGWGRPREEEARLKGSLLVVGIEQRQRESANRDTMNGMFPSIPHHSLSPAISLEVINATLAERYWCQIKNNGNRRDDGIIGMSSNDGSCVSLYECSIWPAAGKEIKDGWIRGSLRRGIDPRDKLYGMLGIQRTSVTNRICCFEGPDSCFVSASSDGTVTMSHYYPEHGSWGVMEEDNQIMLFQRCIGLGTFDYGRNSPYKSDLGGAIPGARRYAVCCLRGGTIYLVPVAENDNTVSARAIGRNDITMFAIPVYPDGDDDGLVRIVQNFTAGMAQVFRWIDQLGTDNLLLIGNADDSSMKSVALVGWPGGNIDVYEIAPDRRRNTDTLIEEIVDRGVVTKLVERMLEIDRSHRIISSDLWRRAWDECHEDNNIDAILKGIKQPSTTGYAAMRSLLLSLTKQESKPVID